MLHFHTLSLGSAAAAAAVGEPVAEPATVVCLARGAGAPVTGVTTLVHSASASLAGVAAGDVVRARAWFRRPAAGLGAAGCRMYLGSTLLGWFNLSAGNILGFIDLDLLVTTTDGTGSGQLAYSFGGQTTGSIVQLGPVSPAEDLATAPLTASVLLTNAGDTVTVDFWHVTVLKAAA